MQVTTVRLSVAGRPAPGARAAGAPNGPSARAAAGVGSAPGVSVLLTIELVATQYLPDESVGPFPGLVVGHGAGSRRARHEPFCREACARGFAVLSLDLRGHGDSGGWADGPLEDDILAAAQFLRQHPAVDSDCLCYRGSSMGGFYGLKAAATPGFAAVALLCPAGERVMLEGLEDTLPVDPSTRWDVASMKAYFQQQDSLALAARVRCPVLLVHARGDDVVPLSHSLALTQHLGGDATLVALAGGSHTSAQHDPAVHRLTAGWLLDHIRSACTGRT
jgi:dipeptidyl aminopeptidase/acylaminoacyl peptidase